MRNVLLAFALTLAATGAVAQDVRPGIASIAVISSEPDGRYGMDGDVVKASKLKRTLRALDEQLAVGYVHLRKGQVEISAEHLAEVRRIADEIGARLMVEKDGRMEPADAPPAVSGT